MTVKGVLKRGIYVLQKEGAWSFLSQVFSFLGGFFYSRGSYYIYEKTLTKNERYQFNTKLQNTTIKIISASEEFEQLGSNGYDIKMMLFKDKLKKGAVAFCAFVNKELAHVTWAAFNEKAKKEIGELPLLRQHFKTKKLVQEPLLPNLNLGEKDFIVTFMLIYILTQPKEVQLKLNLPLK